MGGSALQQDELGFAQGGNREPADHVLPASSGGQVAFEQSPVDGFGCCAQGSGQGTPCAVVGNCCIGNQGFIFRCRKRRIAI